MIKDEDKVYIHQKQSRKSVQEKMPTKKERPRPQERNVVYPPFALLQTPSLLSLKPNMK